MVYQHSFSIISDLPKYLKWSNHGFKVLIENRKFDIPYYIAQGHFVWSVYEMRGFDNLAIAKPSTVHRRLV